MKPREKKPAGKQKPVREGSANRMIVLFLVLTALLAAGGALRFVHLKDIQRSPFFHHPIVDEASYDAKAREIASGHVVGEKVFYQDPLYPYLLAVLYAVIGRNFTVVRIVQSGIGLLNIVVVFLLARKAFDSRTAVIAALLACCYPLFIFDEGQIDKTALCVLLSDLAVLFFLHALNGLAGRYFFLAGIALGAACLVRGNYLLFVPAAVGVTLWTAVWAGKGLRGKLAPAFTLLLGVLIPIAPVTARNYWVGKEFVLVTSQAGQNFYIGNNPYNQKGEYVALPFFRPHPNFEEEDFQREAERRVGRPLTPAQVSRFWFDQAMDYIRQEPLKFLGATLKKAHLFWYYFEIPDNHDYYFEKRYSRVMRLPLPGFGVVAPFAVVGLAFVWRKSRGAAVLAGFVLLSWLSVVFFYVFARYRMPVVPILIVFASAGLLRLLDLPGAKGWAAVVGPVAVLAAAALFVNLPRRKPDFSHGFSNLATVYMDSRRYDSAQDALEKAVEANPDNGTAHFNLASLLEKKGEFPRSQYEYERVHELLPTLAEGWNNHASMEEKLGHPDKAEKYYFKAIEVNPDLREPYVNLIRMFDRVGRPDRAEQICIHYIDRFSDNRPETAEVRRRLSGDSGGP